MPPSSLMTTPSPFIHLARPTIPAFLARVAEQYQLDHLARLAPADALREAAPLLANLARADVLRTLVDRPCDAPARAGEPTVAHEQIGAAQRYALGLFAWPVGASTHIHDHSSWGAFCAVAGSLAEARYDRLDDGAQPQRARLRQRWQRTWDVGTGVSRLRPYAGGIHRVWNASRRPVLSLHLYGPPDRIDGRDYDPRSDYVCDRPLLA